MKAIHSLPLHKAPDPDGYCNEYFKIYVDGLTPHLCKAFNVMNTSDIPKESLEAHIVAIPKPDKPH